MEKSFIIVCLLAGFVVSYTLAGFPIGSSATDDDIYKVEVDGLKGINRFQECRTVWNHGEPNPVMVPTGSSDEWDEFRSNAPSGVEVTNCCDEDTDTDVKKDAPLYEWKYDEAYHGDWCCGWDDGTEEPIWRWCEPGKDGDCGESWECDGNWETK